MTSYPSAARSNSRIILCISTCNGFQVSNLSDALEDDEDAEDNEDDEDNE